MSSLKKLRKRRNYIVDPKLQISLLIRATGFVIVMLLVMCAGLFVPVMRVINSNPVITEENYEIMHSLMYMHENFWPAAGICVLLCVISTILLSHRIAGPLVRVRRILGGMADGRFPEGELRTRDRDYLKDEVELLNNAVQGLRNRIIAIQDADREIHTRLAAAQDAAAQQGSDAVRESLTAVLAAADGLTTQIQSFDLGLPETEPQQTSTESHDVEDADDRLRECSSSQRPMASSASSPSN